jgi:rhodanese-related sulfurtransferase
MKLLMKIIFLIAFIFFSSLTDTGNQDERDAEYLMPVEFDYRYKSEVYALIIDARIARQYRRSRIPGAIGIDRMAKLEVFADTMDMETPLYIYCDGESRSRTVAEYLGDEGFFNLYILKGGIREWKTAGLPLDRQRIRRRR